MIRTTLILTYAGAAYVLALANIAYILAFLADFWVPKSINSGTAGAVLPSILTNLGLIGLFGLHHSATARRWFKAHWTRLVPPALERATYLYMTALVTAALVAFWQPIPAVIWHVEAPIGIWTFYGLFLATALAMFSATFHVGHLGFFGLAQAWSRATGQREPQPSFCARWLYGLLRHPISLGWMLLPWLTPHMTSGQLTWAVGSIAYVLISTLFEEADLVAELGDTYRTYREEVPAYLPIPRRRVRTGSNRRQEQCPMTTS